MAAGNCAPLAWDGTDAGLPDGWDDQFERTVADVAAGRPLDTLGALQIVVARGPPGQRPVDADGGGVPDARPAPRVPGADRVRPAHLEGALPAHAHRAVRVAGAATDGLPFDPWIRVHARAGRPDRARIAGSMRIEGTRRGVGALDGHGVPGDRRRTSCRGPPRPVAIDRDADRGVYLDPNVWMVHDLPRRDVPAVAVALAPRSAAEEPSCGAPRGPVLPLST